MAAITMKELAVKMLTVYYNDATIKESVDNSSEFYRALVYETKVIDNPAQVDGTATWDEVIDALEEYVLSV
jgi:hypothetical protein